jgi:RNA polymerase sigma-70 factor (ECF subfamily)
MTARTAGARHGDPPTQRAREDAADLKRSLRDPDQFGVIFDRYFAEIHGYIARRLGDDAADDIAAETFLTAFSKRGRFDAGLGIVRGWLYGIATRQMSRYRRREVRAYRLTERAAAPAPDAGHADLVVDRVAAGAMYRQIAGALAELSRGDREVLLLIALAGLTHAEVATAVGIPYGTVGSRLNRARRKLRGGLAGTAPLTQQEDQDHG